LKEINPAQSFLHLHILTAKGLENLELIIHIINKRKLIEYSPVLINVTALMLCYMPAYEVLASMQALIDLSGSMLLDQKKRQGMRWHFSFKRSDYFKVLASF